LVGYGNFPYNKLWFNYLY